MRYPDLASRLYANVDIDDETECWVWTAKRHWKGYGLVTIWTPKGARNRRAHRLAFQCYVGSIPDDLPLDHLCCNRACINPAHLEPVTTAENNRRRDERRAIADDWEPPHIPF